jgi:hypothetical protein
MEKKSESGSSYAHASRFCTYGYGKEVRDSVGLLPCQICPRCPQLLSTTMAYKQTGPSRPITLAGNSQKEPKYSGSVGFHLFADPVGRKLIYAEAAWLWNTAAQSGGGARLQAKTVVCVARRQRQVELTRRLEEAAEQVERDLPNRGCLLGAGIFVST